jgi:hypothetical protein
MEVLKEEAESDGKAPDFKIRTPDIFGSGEHY